MEPSTQEPQRSPRRQFILKTLIPVLEALLQKFLDRKRQKEHNMPQINNAQSSRGHGGHRKRHRTKPADISRQPEWTAHHSSYPHHYVRDYSKYAIPRLLATLAQRSPLEKAKRKNRWLFGFKDHLVAQTDYETDRQLRLGFPVTGSERIHKAPKQKLSGSSFLLGSDKFYDHAAEVVAYEVEKEIRKFLDGHVREHGHLPLYPAGVQRNSYEADDDDHLVSEANITKPALKFADLDAEQREFLVAALSKRLGNLIDQSAADILSEVDREQGTLWGIGQDDIIQMTLDRNFNLNSVTLDPDEEEAPRTPTNDAGLGQNTTDTPASSYGPVEVQSTAETTSSARTEWPTPRRLRRAMNGGQTPSTESDERNDLPGPKLRPAEPSFGTVFGNLKRTASKKKDDTEKHNKQDHSSQSDHPHKSPARRKPAEPSFGTVVGGLKRSLSKKHSSKQDPASTGNQTEAEAEPKDAPSSPKLRTVEPSIGTVLGGLKRTLNKRTPAKSEKERELETEEPKDKPAAKSKPEAPKLVAEPSISRVVSGIKRSLSLRRPKGTAGNPDTEDKAQVQKDQISAEQPPVLGIDPTMGRPSTSSNHSMGGMNMKRPHHISLAAALRQSFKNLPTEEDADSTSAKPSLNFGPSSSRKESKSKSHGIALNDTPMSSTVNNLLRMDPIAQAAQRRVDAAKAAENRQRSQPEEQDQRPIQREKSTVQIVKTKDRPMTPELPPLVGLGISYDEMPDRTPPVFGKPSRRVQPPITGPKINITKDGSPMRDENAERRPSGGRLGASNVQNPASAAAPPKKSVGNRLLDRLEAARKPAGAPSKPAQLPAATPNPLKPSVFTPFDKPAPRHSPPSTQAPSRAAAIRMSNSQLAPSPAASPAPSSIYSRDESGKARISSMYSQPEYKPEPLTPRSKPAVRPVSPLGRSDTVSTKKGDRDSRGEGVVSPYVSGVTEEVEQEVGQWSWPATIPPASGKKDNGGAQVDGRDVDRGKKESK